MTLDQAYCKLVQHVFSEELERMGEFVSAIEDNSYTHFECMHLQGQQNFIDDPIAMEKRGVDIVYAAQQLAAFEREGEFSDDYDEFISQIRYILIFQ